MPVIKRNFPPLLNSRQLHYRCAIVYYMDRLARAQFILLLFAQTRHDTEPTFLHGA